MHRRSHSAASLAGSVFILCVFAAPAAAQATPARPQIELTRLTHPIVVDGVPNDAAWRDVAPVPLTVYAPVFRAEPKQRTEIRVAYDDDYFYAAGWFYDTEHAGIRINSLYRDRWNGDDAFAIYIDAFDDKHNAKWFGTTPGGIRFDQLVSDDGNTLNPSWDGFWDARTTVTDSGWFAEVRIPLSTLGFHVDATGKAVMGLTVTRLVSRTGERVTFPEIDPKFEFRNPSVAQDVVLRGVRTRTPVYVTPYALGGAQQKAVTLPAGGFGKADDKSREVGVDIRYPVTSSLTLDVTANTDFAQVEADEQQVSLDRFPLFYPERRRFFQEGSGIFDFTLGNSARLFHSRRIGIAPDFSPVRILGGGRLVGRLGDWDIGSLAMRTDSHDASPGENFGVFRLRRNMFNQGSTLGMLATSYTGGGRNNTAVGTDAVIRTNGDNYLTLKGASTFDKSDTNVTLAERSQIFLAWERRVGRGLQYMASFNRSGANFDPQLGFLQRSNFTAVNVYANYFIFTDKHAWIRRVYPGALAFATYRNSDKVLESGQYAAWVEWDTKAGGGGWLEPKVFHENVVAPFTIGNTTTVPAGSYTFADLQFALAMAQGAKLRTSIDTRAGTYFDGTRKQIIAAPVWNVSPHLELGTDYQLTSLRFPTRHEKADIQVARLRVRAALNARASGNAFIQYNSTTGQADVNLRLRYAFAEGTDLWIVYNEGLDTDRTLDATNVMSPRSLARALIVKYTRTFDF